MSLAAIGTSGLELPSGKGTWNGLFYPATRSKRDGTEGLRRAALLRRAFRHRRGQLDLLRTAASRGHARLGGADAARLRVLAEAVSEVHPSEDVQGGGAEDGARRRRGPLLDLLAQVTQSDIDDFRAGIEPLASAGKLGALLAQFPPSFKDTPPSRDYLAQLLRAFCGLSRRRGTAAPQLERRHRATRWRC